MARKQKKLGEILSRWGVVSANSLADALEYATNHGKRIGEALVELELCSEDDVYKALATQFDMPFVDLTQDVVTKSALDLVPHDLIRRHMVLPIAKEGNRIRVVITDPLDLDTIDMLRFRLNAEIETALAPLSKVKHFIDNFVDPMSDELSKSIASMSLSVSIDEAGADLQQIMEDEAEDAPIIRLINMMIGEAVRSRASDIHIEPMADRVRVRYRIDGVCHVRDDIPKAMQGPMTTRVKILAGIDIAEKRVPQDGRIKMKIGDDRIDFRVSSCPAYHGESIVLRILRPDSVRVGIQALGFLDDDYEAFIKIIKRPNGIFLVTGPTGSGKTTTLYAALQELNRPDRKIITAEDPVEYEFAGMNQCQVREEIGLTFAKILRAMLRQAPNIILVGEIRDKEVGDVAIQAALTGHLVFSTLHTNDAPSAVTRLIDMGIKPFLVASAIQAIMAQRLIRTICEECKVEAPDPTPSQMKLLGFEKSDLEGRPLYYGKGCKRCGGTGYRGRIGIFEMLIMNNEIRELAFNRAGAAPLRKAARASGMRTLLEDGKLKILKGITTMEEIARVAQVEGLADVTEED
ncbi:MAG: type II/IV secretion system protein [Planctomycetes bacterium]|nr:type II/IV secretion system protein [Planctomycetota bacterium]